MAAMMFTRAPQGGHRSMSRANTRLSKHAQLMSAVAAPVDDFVEVHCRSKKTD